MEQIAALAIQAQAVVVQRIMLVAKLRDLMVLHMVPLAARIFVVLGKIMVKLLRRIQPTTVIANS
jgi:hypothetical protein